MRLKTPVTTSFGTIIAKDSIIVEVQDSDGIIGWGESPAFAIPWYSEETIGTVWQVMADFLIPRLAQQECQHPNQVAEIFAPIQRNNMAKAGIESALWDLYAQSHKAPLAQVLGGTRKKVVVGVVIGVQANIAATLGFIEQYLAAGYQRIKLKIKPGQDIALVQGVRRSFPHLSLAVDANGAYQISDLAVFQELDHWGLTMIEQPFPAGDLINHAKLQAVLTTPLCLDESITTIEDIKNAIAFNSCQVMNIKMSRLGGITLAQQAHDLCLQQNIPVWCGGMFESGIGRAHNIALATLDNFSLPGDISSSSRYWERDIIEPEVIVKDGEILVSHRPGIGYQVNREQLEKITLRKITTIL
jgi:O-succinylbenzoate synthase